MSLNQQAICSERPSESHTLHSAENTACKSVVDESRSFNYDEIPIGYYQQIAENGNPIRRAWHLQKFQRIIDCLPKTPGQSILDIGCFAGTFLSLLPEDNFRVQLGVDILERQIDYANERFGTAYRKFQYVKQISDLARINQTFDCITLIEVIEHLSQEEIAELFRQISTKLKKNGRLILSTPNYASLWPLLEIAVNRLSDVSYEEQHVTKFNYFTCASRMKRISPALAENFELAGKATTHFLAPFLAAISLEGSMRLSQMLPHWAWKNPFGSLVLLSFRKTTASALEREEGEHRTIRKAA